MPDHGDLQLFGAQRGRPLTGTITVEHPALTGEWRVRLSIVDEMRKHPMELHAYARGDQLIAPVLGKFTQILEKMYWVDAENIRARMVQAIRWLNREGYGFDYHHIGQVKP